MEQFVNEDLNNIDNLYELFEIIHRIENNFELLHNNIDQMNHMVCVKNSLKENMIKEQKEYNKIMNEIYKFNVDE
jgi:hypothetical protein